MSGSPATSRRNSKQRRILLEELQSVSSHPTAVELYDMARRRLPSLSLGTVYRNLEVLSEMGAIRKLAFGGAEARFDGDASQHHHIRCAGCGRVDDAAGLPEEPALPDVEKVSGYDILGYRLEFIGVCPACSNRG